MAPSSPNPATKRRAFPTVVLCLAVCAAAAQGQDSAAAPPPAPHRVFSRADVATASRWLIAATVAVPLDQAISRAVVPATRANRLDRVTDRVDGLAFPGTFSASYAIFGAGLFAAREDWLSAGWHTFAAVSATTATSSFVKRVVGRARPTTSLGSTHFDLGGRAGQPSSTYAFPSAHTAAAFAAASALSEEVGARSPAMSRFATPVLFSLATAVGVSRVLQGAHWPSDVVAGAALGTFVGRGVVRYSLGHRRNWADRVVVHAVLGCDEQGRAVIAWIW